MSICKRRDQVKLSLNLIKYHLFREVFKYLGVKRSEHLFKESGAWGPSHTMSSPITPYACQQETTRDTQLCSY